MFKLVSVLYWCEFRFFILFVFFPSFISFYPFSLFSLLLFFIYSYPAVEAGKNMFFFLSTTFFWKTGRIFEGENRLTFLYLSPEVISWSIKPISNYTFSYLINTEEDFCFCCQNIKKVKNISISEKKYHEDPLKSHAPLFFPCSHISLFSLEKGVVTLQF